MTCRYVDHIDTRFGGEEGKQRGYCGHPEVELALMKLYRATGERRYLALAHYFVEERGEVLALATSDWEGKLYRTTPAERSPCTLTAIPYYAWDQRQAGAMGVWITTSP